VCKIQILSIKFAKIWSFSHKFCILNNNFFILKNCPTAQNLEEATRPPATTPLGLGFGPTKHCTGPHQQKMGAKNFHPTAQELQTTKNDHKKFGLELEMKISFFAHMLYRGHKSAKK